MPDISNISLSASNKVPMTRYMLLSMALPMVLFYGLSIGVYIVTGLYSSFDNKETEAYALTNILAHNAALNESELVGQQILSVMSNDASIVDIKFHYLKDDNVFIEDTGSKLKQALWNKRLHIYQTVERDGTIANQVNTNAYSSTVQQPTNQNHDSSQTQHNSSNTSVSTPQLVGYITLTIDLQHLRYKWFKTNGWLLILMSLVFLTILWAIYNRLRKPLAQLTEICEQSKIVMQQSDVDTSFIVCADKQYEELEVICHIINLLEQRYIDLSKEHEALHKQGLALLNKNLLPNPKDSIDTRLIHELKKSLSAIDRGLKRLDNDPLNASQDLGTQAIRSGAEELEFVLNQIIQLSRLDKGVWVSNVDKINPRQIIIRLTTEFQSQAKGKGLTLESRIHHVDYQLAGDYHKIYSILTELISNAIKYTTVGGVLIDSKIDCFAESMRWTVQVTDTGCGIAKKDLNDIFLPFYQVRPDVEDTTSGNGIGLGVAQRLTHLLKGELSVESIVREGSTFTLILTLRDWQTNKLYNQLSGNRIIFYTHNGVDFTIDKLKTYGAYVEGYGDIYVITQKLKVRPFDLLLISNQTPHEVVHRLCRMVRQQEAFNRVLIAWYVSDIAEPLLAELEAVGLDYTITPLQSLKQQVSIIKSWL